MVLAVEDKDAEEEQERSSSRMVGDLPLFFAAAASPAVRWNRRGRGAKVCVFTPQCKKCNPLICLV